MVSNLKVPVPLLWGDQWPQHTLSPQGPQPAGQGPSHGTPGCVAVALCTHQRRGFSFFSLPFQPCRSGANNPPCCILSVGRTSWAFHSLPNMTGTTYCPSHLVSICPRQASNSPRRGPCLSSASLQSCGCHGVGAQ